MLTMEKTADYVKRWVAAFESKDLDRVLAFYTNDVIFQSPLVARLSHDPSGTVQGKAALRAYVKKGFELMAAVRPGHDCQGAVNDSSPSQARHRLPRDNSAMSVEEHPLQPRIVAYGCWPFASSARTSFCTAGKRAWPFAKRSFPSFRAGEALLGGVVRVFDHIKFTVLDVLRGVDSIAIHYEGHGHACRRGAVLRQGRLCPRVVRALRIA
jgi:hypothetical protein